MALGRWLGILAYTGLAGERLIETTKKAIAKARRDDNKALKTDAEAADRVKSLLRGKTGKYTLKFSDSEVTREVRSTMKKVRENFKGYVIRRTIESRDFDGNAISELPAYHEAMLMLRQSPEEEAAFLAYTDSMAPQANEARAMQVLGSKTSEVSSTFLDDNCAPPGHSVHWLPSLVRGAAAGHSACWLPSLVSCAAAGHSVHTL